ncbi:enoyl-CoA hydratase-related protein [Phenylobacterium sp.]|uniref:enoyl-CoA hydratase-related protein n=1 Tax=Phenylobacterium sp. TaxID=1871053 RepID=UPI0025D95DCA|nr:enoyl-CoA hydratase-related protein [Phenylobacterium sp.]MBX3485451.1 enoyl-CoA hydratase/isomerase family protein [Phenylobacterium sp.]MCW5758825.1 enoyl-CoA hydratase/isomerase family protein [Phenylobacterium sp.]
MAEAIPEPVLVTERDGAVAVLRLNRPEARNAMSPELSAALGEALLAAEADDTVRAVVITGTGDRAFCAGMDLRAFAAGRTGRAPRDEVRVAVSRLVDGVYGKPVVGAANASAVAGGFEMLMGCDLVVASSEAKFGLPEAKRGLFAARGGMFLAARIPVAIVLELNLIGDPIDAERAYGLGLVNRVVPPSEVLPVAIDLARRIARNAPLAVAAARDLVKLAMQDLPAAQARQPDWRARVFESLDAKEGATAFVEKRDPVWQGR